MILDLHIRNAWSPAFTQKSTTSIVVAAFTSFDKKVNHKCTASSYSSYKSFDFLFAKFSSRQVRFNRSWHSLCWHKSYVLISIIV